MSAATAALPVATRPLPGAMPVRLAEVNAAGWRAAAGAAHARGGRLVSLWAADRRDLGEGHEAFAALADEAGLLLLRLALPDRAAPAVPDLSDLFLPAVRLQRAAAELNGVVFEGARDRRPWLRHGAWPTDAHPLRRDFVGRQAFEPAQDDYPFVAVAGEGVHEIPVGPVHAGTIEPGHFRFSVLGERVLRLEERLGYKHKGIEKRFESLPAGEAHRLAGRVSGDSTVTHAWAYCMALELAWGVEIPPRAAWLRALLLERERVANHLGDLGMLGNDAGLAFGLAQFGRLKEEWLRDNARLCGHRYLMDTVVPGGVAMDVPMEDLADQHEAMALLEAEVAELRAIYEEHAGLQDRFAGCGRVSRDLALRLGLTGMAARASGLRRDLRAELPCSPWDALGVRDRTQPGGDVAARVALRFDEITESLRLLRAILEGLPEDECRVVLPAPRAALGIGWVEGWRGEVMVALETGPDGRVRRCHPHDPSWQNWPALEHAVIGNIVPDFPLINKSFNLSYAGADL
jgi:Ni,Fe-hydrogenase III large subunit/Ni,Fe-hydrogenase III component G